MKRSLAVTVLLLVAGACAAVKQHGGANPYDQPPFYAKYLNTGSQLDAQITATLDALRTTPVSAPLHNDLGALLVQKNFPKDAEVEFERAVADDPKFYPAWYNLGLVRAALHDERGANAAMERTVALKPGHPQALFQLGLTAEKQGHMEKAVHYYAKAFMHNPRLMDVRANPRILDSKLTHLALLELYSRTHSRQSMTFQGKPAGYVEPQLAAPPVDSPTDSTTPQTTAPPPPPTPTVPEAIVPVAAVEPPLPAPSGNLAPVTATNPNPVTQTST